MQVEIHERNQVKMAEVLTEEQLFRTAEDGLQLLADLYYQDVDRIIVHEENITPDFFNLETGIAGEILQKFSNYRVRLAIIGDFSSYTRKSIKDFIYESNKGRQVNFLPSLEVAIDRLSA